MTSMTANVTVPSLGISTDIGAIDAVGEIILALALTEATASPLALPGGDTDQTISPEDSPFFGFDWTTLQSLFTGVCDGSIPIAEEGDAFVIGGDASSGDVGIDLVQSRISFLARTPDAAQRKHDLRIFS